MAVDTPARIAIVGAGPIGLEAALYARFLGYDVEIFDRGEVAENVRRWGHVRMFSPFAANASPLGLAALAAQDEGYVPPASAELLTGAEWRDRYLLPLAQTDLLSDHLRLETSVVAISRRDYLKTEGGAGQPREDSPFRLLTRDRRGAERESWADIVIDTSGVYGNPNWLGPGGGPARGERDARDLIRYGLADILGADRARFAGRRVLIVGAGYSAATAVVALRELARAVPETRGVWVVRREVVPGEGPLVGLAHDPLGERAALVAAANRVAAESGGPVEFLPGSTVAAVHWDAEQQEFSVELAGEHDRSLVVDEVLAHVGYRPETRLFDELRVHLCYGTSGPMKLAACLAAAATADCLQQPTTGPASLLTTEPHFYVLGAKSYGRNPHFLVSQGLNQIRDLFTIIGDRANLDLYQGALRLPK